MSGETRQFIYLLLIIPAIMLATTLHEFTRAAVSAMLGDNTPKNEGRLTLNPIKHFEPIGFLLMFATGISYGGGFGWGKPVNTNPRHYKNRRAGVILAAVLPSLANFITAVIVNSMFNHGIFTNEIVGDFFTALRTYSIYLVMCNLFPVAPFDCMKIIMEFVSRKSYFTLSQQESVLQLILMLLLFSGLLTYLTLPLCSVLYMLMNLVTF